MADDHRVAADEGVVADIDQIEVEDVGRVDENVPADAGAHHAEERVQDRHALDVVQDQDLREPDERAQERPPDGVRGDEGIVPFTASKADEMAHHDHEHEVGKAENEISDAEGEREEERRALTPEELHEENRGQERQAHDEKLEYQIEEGREPKAQVEQMLHQPS